MLLDKLASRPNYLKTLLTLDLKYYEIIGQNYILFLYKQVKCRPKLLFPC